MASNDDQEFVSVFLGRYLPEPASPVGYAMIIEHFKLDVPLPNRLAAIRKTETSEVNERNNWQIFPPSYRFPSPRVFPAALRHHLIFALKYEGIHLIIWKKLFMTISEQQVIAMIRKRPTSSYGRRMWFLYEWLLDRQLDLPDTTQGTYVPVLDPNIQYGASPVVRSVRHRVYNNLPGTPNFCPLVLRAGRIDKVDSLRSSAKGLVEELPSELVARAAAFSLFEDSKASYFIEGETPLPNRIQRWGQAIGQAGKHRLDVPELSRLQHLVLGRSSHVEMGIRKEGGFIGRHDSRTYDPIPAHISARPEDLSSLMQGILDFANIYVDRLNPIVAAAVLAFGFVYIHPFEDGNGRLHRYLIHHVLVQTGFNPPATVFPVSAVILKHMKEYRRVLASYSKGLLRLIRWKPTTDHNVHVENETADFYRYFDATAHTEFLYSCIQETIAETVPEEIEFLRRHDHFKGQMENLLEMPDQKISLLFTSLYRNNGRLSKGAKKKRFASLSEEEILAIEAMYAKISAPGDRHQQHNKGEDLQPA